MKNKYKLLFVFATLGLVFHANAVSAKEIEIKDFDKTIEKYYSAVKDSASYMYVVGDYAFTSEYDFSLQDVMYAITNSKNVDVSNKDKMTIYYLNRTSNDQDVYTGWEEGSTAIGTGSLLKDGKFNISYIDYHDIEDRTEINSDNNVIDFVKGLTGADKYSKDYDEKTGIITVSIKKDTLDKIIAGTVDINSNASDIIAEIKNILGKPGYESIDLTYGSKTVTITKEEAKAENANTNISNKLNAILTDTNVKNNITDLTIDIDLNLGEMYKEVGNHSSGIHKSEYSIKFTSVVDVDEMLEDIVKTGLGETKLSMTLDGTTINVVVDNGATDSDTVESVNGTGLLVAIGGLFNDGRVKQINIGNVVISKTSTDLAKVKEQIQQELGKTTKLTELVDKTLSATVVLNDGLGVLDSKTGTSNETSRTYTIKFINEVKESTKDSIEAVIEGAFSAESVETIEEGSKDNNNTYIVDVKKGTSTLSEGLATTISTALAYYEKVELTFKGKTYTIEAGKTSEATKKELTETLKGKKLSELLGQDIKIKYILKEDTIDSAADVNLGNGYTEYTIKIRYVVGTDETIEKAIADKEGNKLAASDYADSVIGMSFDEKTHKITFELVHPMISIKDLVSSIKTTGTFETKLTNLLKDGKYKTIVVNFGGTNYTLSYNEEEKELVNGLTTLLNSINEKTLYQIKDSKITVTFNLNDGVMDTVHGDTKKIEYTIELSDKMNIQEKLEEALKGFNGKTVNSKIAFNEEEKVFYLLYSDGTKNTSEFDDLISTQLFGESGTITKLAKDERVESITITIGEEHVTVNSSSAWAGLDTNFDTAITKLVKDALEALKEKFTDADNVTLKQLQSVVNDNDLLKIKVTLKDKYAVTEENKTTSYEYSMKLSRYANTLDRINNISISTSSNPLTEEFSLEKHLVEESATGKNLIFEVKNSGNPNIYTSLKNGSYSSVVVSGRKTGTDTLTTLVTLTKENTSKDTDGKFDETDNVKALKFAIKDLVGIGADATSLTDLIGYDIVIKINMADGCRSEFGNKSETYTIRFVE